MEALGPVLILVSIPLLFRWIPQNRIYGFRRLATLRKTSVWYDANALCARHLILLGLARVKFGGPMQAIEALREPREFPWVGGFWLDVKLGVRMLRKSWGLTLVGGLAMTVVMGTASSPSWLGTRRRSAASGHHQRDDGAALLAGS